MEREQEEFVHAEIQSREGKRKRGFWVIFVLFWGFLFVWDRMAAKNHRLKTGFSLHFRFDWTQCLMLPPLAPCSTAKIAAFFTDAHEICAVDGDQPLQQHTHPISSAFSELKGKKKSCHAFLGAFSITDRHHHLLQSQSPPCCVQQRCAVHMVTVFHPSQEKSPDFP